MDYLLLILDHIKMQMDFRTPSRLKNICRDYSESEPKATHKNHTNETIMCNKLNAFVSQYVFAFVCFPQHVDEFDTFLSVCVWMCVSRSNDISINCVFFFLNFFADS